MPRDQRLWAAVALVVVFAASLAGTISFGRGGGLEEPRPSPSPSSPGTAVEVPDLVGSELGPARAALLSRRLRPLVVERRSLGGGLWPTVHRQEPEPGVSVRRRDQVTVFVNPDDRPRLRLPDARGRSCPESRPRHSGRSRVALGDGPVVVGSAEPDGAVRLEGKVGPELHRVSMLWGLDGSYEGPVLIRGAKIDGVGDLRFRQDPVPNRTGQFVFGAYNEARFPPGALTADVALHVVVTFVGGPGCYAFQIDGDDLRQIIVVRAVI